VATFNPSGILIIGANGQVGKALRTRFPEASAVGHDELDITDITALASFDWSKVDIIINAAAFTNVDGAEAPDGRVAAWQINAVAVGHLAKIAQQQDITLVHISSEYVFDGTRSPHTEDEPVSPLGVYAQTKAAGDIAAATAAKHYILRTSWVIGDGANFVRTMIGLARRDISPSVVSDQIGRLTFSNTLVDAISHLLETNAAYGTYNVSDDGEPASWADVTRAIFTELNRGDLTVTDTTTTEYFASKPEAAPRPLQSTLDLGKLKATGLELPDWHTNLRNYIEQQPKE
jgi:dTDP-4-dehydrorhamnose 3,5-epimerase/reductase